MKRTVKAVAVFLALALCVTLTAPATAYAATAKPAKVASLKKSAVTATTIKVKYKKAARAKGYQVQYSTKSSMKSAKTAKSTKTSATIQGLKAGTTYYIRVRAYNKNKQYGKWSSKIKVKTTSAKPAKVTSVKKTAATDSTISIQYAKAKNASGYQIECGPVSVSNGKTTVITSTKTSATLKGLSGETTYRIRVRAYNIAKKKQYGKWSDEITVTTEHTHNYVSNQVLVKAAYTETVTHPAGMSFTPNVEKDTVRTVYNTKISAALKKKTQKAKQYNYNYVTRTGTSTWVKPKTKKIKHKAGTIDERQVYVEPTFTETKHSKVTETVTYPERYNYGLELDESKSTEATEEEIVQCLSCKKFFHTGADWELHAQSAELDYQINGTCVCPASTHDGCEVPVEGATEYWEPVKEVISEASTETVVKEPAWTSKEQSGGGLSKVNTADVTTELEQLIDEGTRIKNWSSKRKAYIKKCLNYAKKKGDTSLYKAIKKAKNKKNKNEQANILKVLKKKRGKSKNTKTYKTTTLVTQYNVSDWTETRVIKDGYYKVKKVTEPRSIELTPSYTYYDLVYNSDGSIKYNTEKEKIGDYTIRTIVTPFTYGYHDEEWTETIEHEAEYERKYVCTICGATKE